MDKQYYALLLQIIIYRLTYLMFQIIIFFFIKLIFAKLNTFLICDLGLKLT